VTGKVVLTAAFPAIAREILSPFDLVEHPTKQARTEDEVITLLRDADAAVILLSDPITQRVLDACPRLRIVANFAVGYNNIDIDAARNREVVVTNTPGVLTEATADLTMALLLAVSRRIVEGDAEVRNTGRCEWEPLKLLGASLQQKRLGIIGLGRIGKTVADRAWAFGMDVVHHSSSSGVSLDELLSSSDFVSIHAPLSPATRHLIDRRALGVLKPGAYLINTSRGPIVDEAALCDALEAGHLRGAALDVYEDEPAVNPRLLRLHNVVIVPHIGSATEEARNGMARIAATEVANFLRGMPNVHRVV
jgi:glyoxylate reductase